MLWAHMTHSVVSIQGFLETKQIIKKKNLKQCTFRLCKIKLIENKMYLSLNMCLFWWIWWVVWAYMYFRQKKAKYIFEQHWGQNDKNNRNIVQDNTILYFILLSNGWPKSFIHFWWYKQAFLNGCFSLSHSHYPSSSIKYIASQCNINNNVHRTKCCARAFLVCVLLYLRYILFNFQRQRNTNFH